METLLENTYICDKKMMREFYRKYSVGPTPIISIVTAVLMLIELPALVVGIMLRRDVWMLAVMYLVFILVQFFPRLFTWANLRNAKKQNDGVMPETRVVFSDENIQMFEGMVHLTVEYRKITRAIRLKHSYALMTGKRTAVLIKPDGFTRGSLEELRRFLGEKCPGIQIAE
jgi:hypothetical protein